MGSGRVKLRWVIMGVVILSLIIIPFLLFGDIIEDWTDEFLTKSEEHNGIIAAVLGGLLASDILMPIPSSIVSTACGLFLGVALGTLTSLAGMTISCVIGYVLGRWIGRPLARKLLGVEEIERLKRLEERFGQWVIVITRPVPVLAEAAVLMAGLGEMSVSRFLLLSTLSNAGISLAYAVIGAYSAGYNSFLLAFGGALLLPLLFMGIERIRRRS